MSIPRPPDPARLVVSVFMNDRALAGDLVPLLENLFGPVTAESPWFDFDYTDYYTREMGTPLHRKLYAFQRLIRQDALAGIKETTNALETRWARQERRCINIDPGYLLLSRFVLATGKDFAHRICIGRRIYAEVTLMFQKGRAVTLPWTYPDYASDGISGFLLQVRRQYVVDLRDHRKTV